jgi:hypothetical protein
VTKFSLLETSDILNTVEEVKVSKFTSTALQEQDHLDEIEDDIDEEVIEEEIEMAPELTATVSGQSSRWKDHIESTNQFEKNQEIEFRVLPGQ